MKNDLTNDEIVAKIEQAEASSYGIHDAELAADREEAFKFYQGEKFGNEVEGRSQVISRDVLDTIESALPQLLKIFVSGDEVVRFTARGPEDEQKAEQETAAVNFYTMEKNDGFAVFYTWFKDALLSKNGYVKVWWEEAEETETESYQGLTDGQLQMLVQDERIEVLEHSEYPDRIAEQQKAQAIQQLSQAAQADPNAAQQLQQVQSQPIPNLHDVKIQITDTKGCVKICNVAPEDILVGQDTREVSLQNATFVQHRALMDEHEIAEQGWEIPDGALADDSDNRWSEAAARDLYGENDLYNEKRDQYLVKDTYIRLNGSLWRIVVIGHDIVHKEEAEIIPFACITPHIMPHRHIGMSYADLTKDIQLIKSTLLRGQLDAMYLANAPRFAVSDRVSLEDMLVSRPGGIVRVQGDPMSAIMPLQAAPFPTTSFTLVEYLDAAKERRTGVTAYNQGLDANSLNKTATGVNQILQASQERLSLVARTFANTGVKELFMLVHRLVRKYATRPEIIRLRNEWVDVDPREWKERKDLQVNVGLGTGNRDTQLMHLQGMWQRAIQEVQMGLPTASPQNIYEINRQLAINSGFKQPEQFTTNPAQIPPQPPQPNPMVQVEQMKLQAKQQEMQQNAQLEMQKFQAQSQMEQQKAQAQLQQEQLRSQNDVQIEQAKVQAQMELEKWKAELDAATELRKTQMQLEAEKEIELFKAQNESATALAQHRTELGGIVERAKGAKGDESMAAIMQGLNAMVQSLNVPKQIIRDQNGKAVGVAPMGN